MYDGAYSFDHHNYFRCGYRKVVVPTTVGPEACSAGETHQFGISPEELAGLSKEETVAKVADAQKSGTATR